jgi:uncharacterized protein YqeY
MLQEQINLKWKELFKARDAVGKSAFECVKSKILVAEKSGNYELPLADSIVEGLIVKEVKELQETKTYYKPEDTQYKDLDYKISLLNEYLPKQMSAEEVKAVIARLYQQEQNKGKLIGLTVKEVGSKFDKSKIAGLVNEVVASIGG